MKEYSVGNQNSIAQNLFFHGYLGQNYQYFIWPFSHQLSNIKIFTFVIYGYSLKLLLIYKHIISIISC